MKLFVTYRFAILTFIKKFHVTFFLLVLTNGLCDSSFSSSPISLAFNSLLNFFNLNVANQL